MVSKQSYYQRRLQRLSGMSPEKLAAMHEAAGSQMWWCRCWNCRKNIQMRRDVLDHSSCPHCGKDLWHRS